LGSLGKERNSECGSNFVCFLYLAAACASPIDSPGLSA
jgi:hypothetical protein